MTRGFWGGVMLFSLAVTGGAGWFVVNNLHNHATVSVPLKEISNPAVKDISMAGPPVLKAVPLPTEEPKKNAVTEPTPTTVISPAIRRILFTYRNAFVHKVYIVGDFNKWSRQPMIKKDKLWTATIEIKPGTYEYKFVVDNKRIKDPNNKSSSKAGNSLIIVKPASAG